MSWLLLALLGCPADTPSDSEDTLVGVSDSDTPPCTATVLAVDPTDGATGVSIYTLVTATFSAEVNPGEFSVDVGVAGATELSDDGTSATFTPTEPLEPGLGYTVTANACDDSAEASFTTATDEADPEVVAGRVYALDLYTAEWTRPALLALLESELEDSYWLLEVQALDPETNVATVSGAMGVIAGGGVKQQRCVAPWMLEPAVFANPELTVGPQTLEVTLGDASTLPIEDFTLSGALNAAADALEDVQVTGLIDTAPLDEAYGSSLGISFCAISSEAGEACVPCADGREACLEAEMSASQMPYVEDLDIDEAYEPSSDESCP